MNIQFQIEIKEGFIKQQNYDVTYAPAARFFLVVRWHKLGHFHFESQMNVIQYMSLN